jgi:hypothetical protein
MICNFFHYLFLKFVPKNSTSIATALVQCIFLLANMRFINLQLDSHIIFCFRNQAVFPYF